jgi:hypothetical protein
MRLIPARFVARLSLAVTVVLAVAAVTILTLSFSAPPLSAATPPPPPLSVGQGIFTTNQTNVRATADGTLVGTQPRYATGTVSAGPTFVSADSAYWVKVTFDRGPSGWVGADMLINGIPTPTSVNVGTPGGLSSMVLDENANIEIVYSTGVDSNNNVLYSFRESTNQGLSFSTPSPLPVKQTSTFQQLLHSPQIAAERNGALDIVYTCAPGQCPPSFGVPSVNMIRSIDHGATWSAPILISIPPNLARSGAGAPVIAACGTGVTIAWIDDGVGSKGNGDLFPDLFIVNVVNGVPGAPINVTDDTRNELNPQILVNPQGSIYLSWTTNDSSGSAATVTANFASIPNCAAVAQ